jgi:hypothetical protein
MPALTPSRKTQWDFGNLAASVLIVGIVKRGIQAERRHFHNARVGLP